MPPQTPAPRQAPAAGKLSPCARAVTLTTAQPPERIVRAMDELLYPVTPGSSDGSELADDDALLSSPDGSEPEAVGLEVDELVGPTVKMRMRKVMLGTFDCGGCEVVFARDCVRFFPDEDHAPPSGAGLIEFNLARVEVDMTKSVLCLTNVFSYKIAGHFAYPESSEGVLLPIPATLHGPGDTTWPALVQM